MSDRHRTRKEFIGITGAAAAGAVGGEWLVGARSARAAAQAGDPRDPDLVVHDARVYTVDRQRPRAEAFAVKDGRFVAVGSNERIKGLAGRRTQRVDADGMTVVPGFIDTHNHAPGVTLVYEVLVGDPYEVGSVTIASVIEKLRARAAKTPADTWVQGYFYDDTKSKDRRPVNVHDLDQVSTTQPVAVNHRGGHTSYYNSRAFQLAGITKDTPNPPGGTFDKDAHGELNGRVTDNANDVFDKVGGRPAFTPDEERVRDRNGLAFISRKFVEYGLTTVHHEGGDLTALQQIRDDGRLLHRVSFEARGALLDAMIANGIRSGFGDDTIRFGACSEHTVDGSFSERTMAMSVPFPGSNPPYFGNVTTTQDDLNAFVERLHRAGVQVNCHANGDVAIGMYLTAIERAQQRYKVADARPKITHCTMVNDSLLRRMKAAGCVVSPFTTYAYYNSDKFALYGAQLMRNMLAYRSFARAGIPAAAGSDFGPGPFAPLMGIQGMVTRTGWDGKTWGANQRISVDEALRVMTLNGAYNNFEEDIKGSIAPGKLADYVMLEADPHRVRASRIKDIKINRTVVGGRTVYTG